MIKSIKILFIVVFLAAGLTGCNTGEPFNDVSENVSSTEETVPSVEEIEETNESSSFETEETGDDGRVPGHIIESSEDLKFPLGETVPFLDYFSGNAYLYPLASNEEVFNLPSMFNVTFEPGVRTSWHGHAGGQILMVTGGMGYYQEVGQSAQILREGDIVKIEPDIRHWHGAAADSWFSHIAISPDPENPGTEWMEAVADEEYNHLETEEFSGRGAVADHDEDNVFLFARGDALNMETFNGTSYVAPLLQPDDVFDIPGMMNVIFEPGVINNWHSHAGGQVLIATDGVGFLQLRGQPAQVLYPGDVAYCPPNEVHWHGAGNDGWFAHIAISTNPEQRGMEWLEPVTEEEYTAALEELSSEP